MKRVAELEADINSLRSRNAAAEERISSISAALDEETAARKAAEERAASALRELSAQQTFLDAEQARIVARDMEQEDSMKRLVELTADINSQRSKSTAEQEDAQQRITQLSNINQELRVEINGLRSKFAAQQQEALATPTAMQAQRICREETQRRKAAEKRADSALGELTALRVKLTDSELDAAAAHSGREALEEKCSQLEAQVEAMRRLVPEESISDNLIEPTRSCALRNQSEDQHLASSEREKVQTARR